MSFCCLLYYLANILNAGCNEPEECASDEIRKLICASWKLNMPPPSKLCRSGKKRRRDDWRNPGRAARRDGDRGLVSGWGGGAPCPGRSEGHADPPLGA